VNEFCILQECGDISGVVDKFITTFVDFFGILCAKKYQNWFTFDCYSKYKDVKG